MGKRELFSCMNNRGADQAAHDAQPDLHICCPSLNFFGSNQY